MTDKPVIIETVNGAQYEIANAELARRVHPGCKILKYADGSAYEASTETVTEPPLPASASPANAPLASEAPPQPAPTAEVFAPETAQPETPAPTTTEAAG